MKTVIALFALVGAQAFACPNLTGSYICTYEGQTQVSVISQAVDANGITTYTLGSEADPTDGGSLPADNNTYQVPDSADFKQGTIRGYCEADAFKVAQTGQVFDQGQHIGNVEAVTSLSLVDNNLLQATTGVFKAASGDYPINQSLTCTRK